MIKLAIVRQKYRPDGGAERFVASALSALSQQKAEQQQLDITVLTRQWNGIKNPSVHIEVCNPFKWGRVSRERGFARAAQKHFSSFDIVQSHERIPGCTIYRAGDGVHKCWLEHRSRIIPEAQAKRMKNDRFHRYVMDAEKQMFEHPKLKAVICISEMVKREIIREFDIDESKLHVIYNSVDSNRFTPTLRDQFRASIRSSLGITDSATCLIFVGSGFERKGLAEAIKAVAKAGAELIVVGKDKSESMYRKLAEAEGVPDRVHFVGVQERPESYYAAADGFILPTIYEPFGNVVLEAMASGLGVITTPTCGGSDIIQSGKNGYICDALDSNSLAEAVSHFCSTEKALMLGKEARKTAEQHSPQRLGHELLKLYGNVLR
ncbi:glycosyltransferase family 4 protein [Endozoicomonas sp. ALE010]|uniref:glycosyltransferase family 4 protein n=1 Tax=Endozoicomonas sp. ALE010 TaxID=3403081 RepID=UPI003BB6A014